MPGEIVALVVVGTGRASRVSAMRRRLTVGVVRSVVVVLTLAVVAAALAPFGEVISEAKEARQCMEIASRDLQNVRGYTSDHEWLPPRYTCHFRTAMGTVSVAREASGADAFFTVVAFAGLWYLFLGVALVARRRSARLAPF